MTPRERVLAILIVLSVVFAPLYLFDVLKSYGQLAFVGLGTGWFTYIIYFDSRDRHPRVSPNSPVLLLIVVLSVLLSVAATFAAIWKFDLSGTSVGGAAMLGGLFYLGASRIVFGKSDKPSARD